MKHEQLQLSFDVLIEPVIESVADPYWDEVEETSDTVICAFFAKVESKIFDFGVDKQVAHQQIATVGEQPSCQDSQYKSVGEQVVSDTLKVAHQHDGRLYSQHTEAEPTHWVEKYWVERGTNKYWYYRYTWMEFRKLHRVYIGSITSNKANLKKQAVEDAIADGELPQDIKQLIRGFSSRESRVRY